MRCWGLLRGFRGDTMDTISIRWEKGSSVSGIVLINSNTINSTFTGSLLRRIDLSRLVVISHGARGTTNSTVSLRSLTVFSKAAIIHTNGCRSTTSASIMIVATNVPHGPNRDHLSLIGGGINVLGAVVSPVIGDNFGKVFIITSGPISVLAALARQVSNFPGGQIVNAKASLSATELQMTLTGHYRIPMHRVDISMLNRRNSASFTGFSRTAVTNGPLGRFTSIDSRRLTRVRSKIGGGNNTVVHSGNTACCNITHYLSLVYRTVVFGHSVILPLSTPLGNRCNVGNLCLKAPTSIGQAKVHCIVRAPLSGHRMTTVRRSTTGVGRILSNIRLWVEVLERLF